MGTQKGLDFHKWITFLLVHMQEKTSHYIETSSQSKTHNLKPKHLECVLKKIKQIMRFSRESGCPPLKLCPAKRSSCLTCFIRHANLFGTDLCHWAHHLLERKKSSFLRKREIKDWPGWKWHTRNGDSDPQVPCALSDSLRLRSTFETFLFCIKTDSNAFLNF